MFRILNIMVVGSLLIVFDRITMLQFILYAVIHIIFVFNLGASSRVVVNERNNTMKTESSTIIIRR